MTESRAQGRPVYRSTQGTLNDFAEICHEAARRWWLDRDGNPISRNRGEMIALIHSELSEALEGERKGLVSDHIPEFSAVEEEMADALIRIFDYAGGFGLDLAGAFAAKVAYNAKRQDHTYEAREAAGGKAF